MRPLISDFTQPRPCFDWLLVSLLTARRLDSCLGRRTSRVSTRRLCEAGAHGSLETHILVRGARLPNPQACLKQSTQGLSRACDIPRMDSVGFGTSGTLFILADHTTIPRLQLYAQGQLNTGGVGCWGTCGLLARSSATVPCCATVLGAEESTTLNAHTLTHTCRHVLLRVSRPIDPSF